MVRGVVGEECVEQHNTAGVGPAESLNRSKAKELGEGGQRLQLCHASTS